MIQLNITGTKFVPKTLAITNISLLVLFGSALAAVTRKCNCITRYFASGTNCYWQTYLVVETPCDASKPVSVRVSLMSNGVDSDALRRRVELRFPVRVRMDPGVEPCRLSAGRCPPSVTSWTAAVVIVGCSARLAVRELAFPWLMKKISTSQVSVWNYCIRSPLQ